MKKFFKNIIAIFFLVFLIPIYGQQENSEIVENPILVLRARIKKNTVLLRWGVDEKFAWKYGNKYGYIIERATIFRDDKPLKKSEKTVLSGGAIKPKPLGEWRNIVQNNNNAAIAAQAIYGEDFNTNNEDNIVMQIVNQSSELQQRFAFSMFAVDQSFEAAKYAGLGFIDDTVKPNERYLYNIKMAAPEEVINLKETGVLINMSETESLPKPYDFAGYYYNDAFVLIWEYDALMPYYNAYDLEKSEDGVSFKKINKVPITKLANTTTTGISFTDSIPKYGQKYFYRIKGKTIFDEISPSSDTISVIGYKELLVAPELKDNQIISDKEVILNWAFAQDEAWKVKGFDILRANKPIGPYITIKEDLEDNVRSYKYSKLQDVNYFKIRAKGIAGDYQDSSPNMVQPIDSIPPVKPFGLIGKIDTLGIVKLSWDKNLELDLKGYSILRANRANQEFTRLEKQEFIKNNYTDTVNLRVFNKKVYYKVVAVDNRYNESVPSDILILNRPDKIPPSNPIFTGYELKDEGVSLKWQKSESEDAVKQIIYRQKIALNSEVLWQNIYETNDTLISSYTDTTVETNTKYAYTIVAVDQSGLESTPSPVVSVTTKAQLLHDQIKGFYATANREDKYLQLNWRIGSAEDIFEIQLFKKNSQNGYTLFKTLDPNQNYTIDSQLTPNTIYFYGIKAIFNDGSISKWNEIEVKY